MKKLVRGLFCAFLSISMTACAFNVNVQTEVKNGDGNELFTDKEQDGIFSTNAYIAYDFSLEQYGKMKIYVDISQGHSFKLESEESGFNILDKNGDVVLYARAMNDEAYEEYSSKATEEKTFNGRTFKFIGTKSDDAMDAFTYLNDVGIDAGFVMETHTKDESVFSLVAFRGNPIEKGSVSKVSKEETKTDTTTNSTLSSEVKEKLSKLESDYSKVKWGVQYSLTEEYEGLVVSVTPEYDGYSNYLIVALTSLYEEPIDISANLEAKDKSDSIVGDKYIYTTAIGKGNTVVYQIYCGDSQPDGRIHWSDVEIKKSNSSFVAWEADYNVNGKKGESEYKVSYELYSANKEDFKYADVCALLLDDEGYVIGFGSDYVEETKATEKAKGEISLYGKESVLSEAKDIALFANPVKY